MALYFIFRKEKNYIGNAEWQHKVTKKISLLFPEINFTAAKHDLHYALMLGEKNHVIRFILKIFYDLIFLFGGILRLLFKPKQWGGIAIVCILYFILLITTPYTLFKYRKDFRNLGPEKKVKIKK